MGAKALIPGKTIINIMFPEESLMRRYNRIVKRTLDLIGSSIGLVIFPLVLIPVAVAIKIDSRGPVFYRQLRTGRNGRLFTCYKFRTMSVDADENPVRRSDPRVTHVGRFLRRTSIDELPQLINVFLGQMSLVGPRPHIPTHTLFYGSIIPRYNERLAVKPGITGWAQVNGYRGSTDRMWKMERRIEHDLWYITHQSFCLDLRILRLTFRLLYRGDPNAY
ncbi:MAG: sugar transferase [Paramuribaculum sp.]|nr:sugar transferase [Paramuribaculum sp.]